MSKRFYDRKQKPQSYKQKTLRFGPAITILSRLVDLGEEFITHPTGRIWPIFLALLPAMLGIPGLVPPSWTPAILFFIGVISCYGVARSNFEEQYRDNALVDAVEKTIKSKERENTFRRKRIFSLEGEIEALKREINTLKKSIEAEEQE